MDELIIEAGRRSGQWREVWRYRELFYFLAWRDVVVRYKQTAAGIAWAWLRPVTAMVVATVVFGSIAGLPSGGAPYPVMVFAGMLPWQLFANALSDSGNSLIGNSSLIVKVYFPRIVIPASSVITAFVDFLIAGVLLVVLLAWYGIAPTWRLVALPWFVVLVLVAALGAGLWLAAVTVKYRDFRFVVPFIVQFGFFVTPVAYTSGAVPAEWRAVYALNPLAGIIDGFRWALLGGAEPLHAAAQIATIVETGALLASGLLYFRRSERSFADVI